LPFPFSVRSGRTVLLAKRHRAAHGGGPEGTERVHAAVVIPADGDVDRLVVLAPEAEQDWRDVLVAAGLAGEGWPERGLA
jgi:hypothetical protein